jgi:crossover junction endodeoxyribonuclease RusA
VLTLPFDFVIRRRPVSAQTGNRANLQRWIRFVRDEAALYVDAAAPLNDVSVSVSLVYLRREGPGDIDNIVKPILDGLCGTVYADDSQVVYVSSSLMDLSKPVDITDLPTLLLAAVVDEDDAVYVRISEPKKWKDLL